MQQRSPAGSPRAGCRQSAGQIKPSCPVWVGLRQGRTVVGALLSLGLERVWSYLQGLQVQREEGLS